MSKWGRFRWAVGFLVPWGSEGRITAALVLSGFLLQCLLEFLDQILYRKMTHVPTYSKNMSLFLLLKTKIWLL